MIAEYWTDRTTWPFVTPGFAFLPEAFDRVGKELYGADWTGREWVSDDEASSHRRSGAFDAMHQAAAAGELVFTARRAAVGQMEPLGRELWNCDRPVVIARFNRCAISWTQAMIPPPPALGDEEEEEEAPGEDAGLSIVEVAANVRNSLEQFAQRQRDAAYEYAYWSTYIDPLFVESSHLAKATEVIGKRFRGEPVHIVSGSVVPLPDGRGDEVEGTRPAKQRRRQRKWDWSGAWAYLTVQADLDGFADVSQAAIVKMLATWFAERNDGNSPADSHLKSQVKRYFDALEERNQRSTSRPN